MSEIYKHANSAGGKKEIRLKHFANIGVLPHPHLQKLHCL